MGVSWWAVGGVQQGWQGSCGLIPEPMYPTVPHPSSFVQPALTALGCASSLGWAGRCERLCCGQQRQSQPMWVEGHVSHHQQLAACAASAYVFCVSDGVEIVFRLRSMAGVSCQAAATACTHTLLCCLCRHSKHSAVETRLQMMCCCALSKPDAGAGVCATTSTVCTDRRTQGGPWCVRLWCLLPRQ